MSLHEGHTLLLFLRSLHQIINSLAKQLCSGNYYPLASEHIIYKGRISEFTHYHDRIVQCFLLGTIRPSYKHIIHPQCYHRLGPSGSRKALSYLQQILYPYLPSSFPRHDLSDVLCDLRLLFRIYQLIILSRLKFSAMLKETSLESS